MDVSQSQVLLKRPVSIKAVVTPRWKEEAQVELQAQINRLDKQLQQLDSQGQRAIAEIQKQSIQPPGPEVTRQIENIQLQVNQKKSEMLDQKNQVLNQLNQVHTLELEQEVNQGQIDSFFHVAKGDNLIEKMQVEILLRDGIVEDIRGEL
jgi:NADH dehydrogenase/NADH:ubiquinone oxidoreductase subunit G